MGPSESLYPGIPKETETGRERVKTDVPAYLFLSGKVHKFQKPYLYLDK